MALEEEYGSSSADAASHHRGKVIMLAVAAAVGGFLFGFDSSVINGAVDAIAGHFALSAFVKGLVVAIALLGSAVGAWLAGGWADRWGRTRVMVIGAVLFALSAVGSSFPFAAWDLAFWRVVGGVGIGIASVIAPAYIAEIAPAAIRGRLGSLQQLAIVLGIFVALLSDAFFLNAAGTDSTGEKNAQNIVLGLQAWQWMFLVGVIPAIVYGILALQIPESPRFLVAKGRMREALKVLHTTVGDEAEQKAAEIKETLDTEHQPTMKDIRGPAFGLMPIVWVGIALSAFQQLVGINVIFYYSTTLWSSVGFSKEDSALISVFTSVLNILVTLVAIALVDKIGRKRLLLIGSAGMAISLGLATVAFTQSSIDSSGAVHLGNPWGLLALIGANMFVVFFGATWGPVVWVLLGEMFPNKIRAAALSVAAAAQWICNFLITVSFPVMSEKLGLPVTYGFYVLCAVLSFIFVKTKVVETRGLELEEMGTGKLAEPIVRRSRARHS
ncbi:sugar porter (SP) family MFS transporter [Antricoccus suffuscus]|uniref:Sugar porter (SP) family MFS transporter n=1 Tax=Antricoccus suffuscus TaxID=1629062 RepID=A0A2T0ZXV8_9ACTN|nr:sugar porter family MFS transporter [Antricoccus suffuscus]PRZ41191.1 sugar porter (SP) family MFS transporter [Antricoccus suffuscus]